MGTVLVPPMEDRTERKEPSTSTETSEADTEEDGASIGAKIGRSQNLILYGCSMYNFRGLIFNNLSYAHSSRFRHGFMISII
mmetsp:Transcript_3855/g.7288  ORF Transcript_3855/g.7288 Transcript_3855/m.7288 type:complete len:82 (+) Transcript_3855:174-419(+)